MREQIIKFVGNSLPQFWGYFADYDWVLFTGIFGGMLKMPPGWPQLCLDIKQSAIERGTILLPMQTSTKHHALNDAIWAKEAYEFLDTVRIMPK